jgi:hypothetical protein
MSQSTGQCIDVSVVLRDLILLTERVAALENMVKNFTSTNTQSDAICAYFRPGHSCPFHCGKWCEGGGCEVTPRKQRTL